MTKKPKTSFRFLFPTAITIGLLFFVLPDWNLFDFLPDFIGFIILYFLLERIAELDSRTAAARRYMLGFALLSIAKMAAALMSGGFSESSDLLLASTVFNLSGAILFFVMASNLFSGLNYTLMRNNAEGSLKALDDAKTLTFFFGFSKLALNFLPQLFALIEVGDGSVQSRQFYNTLQQVQSVTILFSLTASLFLGIYWFMGIRKLLSAFKRDTVFLQTAFNKYDNEVGQNTRYLSRKKWLAAKYTAGVGFVLLLTIQLDGRQFMPWFVSGAMFALAAFILSIAYKNYCGKDIGINRSFYLLCGAFCASEAASFVYRNGINLEFYLKYSSLRMITLAGLASLSAILLALIATKLLGMFRAVEEVLFDVRLGNRYKFQYLFLFFFIALRAAQTAAQPLRATLGTFEIIAFVVFVTVYFWYLRKKNN